MVDEGTPRAGAIDPCRLERLLRSGMQPGQQDQEHQRSSISQTSSADDADEGLDRVGQDLNGCPTQASEKRVSMPTSLA